MQLTNSLLLAAAASISGTYALQNADVVHVVVREMTTIALPKRSIPLLFRRDSSECEAAATTFVQNIDVDSLPTPDAQLIQGLESYYSENTEATDTCSVSFTGALSSEYAVYTSGLSSWVEEHSSDLKNFLQACTDVPEISSSLAQRLGSCTGELNKLVGGSGDSATETGSASGASSTGDADKGSAAPRFAGSVVGVVGVVGLAGLVALAL